MALNQFFSNYNYMPEQNLLEDLVIEAIRIFGINTFFIKRTDGPIDPILNEDDTPTYDDTYELEMYVKNVEGFGGEGDFLSKFGLQIRDQMTLVVARKVFDNVVTKSDSSRPRPMEGDLIWIPMFKKMLEITFVEHEAVFYQGGKLQGYELRCELFEWNNDSLPSDDMSWADLEDRLSTDQISNLDDLEEIDPAAKNADIQDIENEIVDFSEDDPFSEDNDWATRNEDE